MKNQEIKQDVKLGAFVLVGVLFFLVAVFYIGSENNIFNRTLTISAIFKNVEGLKPGDNVWLSGVKVGTVKDVRIVSEGKVIVDLSLKANQSEFIRRNATASIGSDGLVGNKIVVIRPGNATASISDSDTINSMSPADTQQLMNIAKDVGQNTRDITENLKTIAAKISQGQGIVGELLNEGPLARDLRDAIAGLRTTGKNATQVTYELNSLVQEMRNGDGLLPTLISDSSYEATFRSAVANIEKVSDNSVSMARNLEEVIAKVNDKNNAVGVLLADTVFANKLQKTMNHAQEASAKLDENMEAMQHNFLLRGYFRKKEKREKAEQEAAASAKLK